MSAGLLQLWQLLGQKPVRPDLPADLAELPCPRASCCASTASRPQVSASAVSTTLANIPAAITECALVRNQHLQNKTPEEDLSGPG